jgi:hypothetical protein
VRADRLQPGPPRKLPNVPVRGSARSHAPPPRLACETGHAPHGRRRQDHNASAPERGRSPSDRADVDIFHDRTYLRNVDAEVHRATETIPK